MGRCWSATFHRCLMDHGRSPLGCRRSVLKDCWRYATATYESKRIDGFREECCASRRLTGWPGSPRTIILGDVPQARTQTTAKPGEPRPYLSSPYQNAPAIALSVCRPHVVRLRMATCPC